MVPLQHQIKNEFTNNTLRPVHLSTIRLITRFPIQHEAHHLRGFFGHKYPEFSLLHNHNPDGTRILGYPRVQYKVLGNKAYIIGINEGAKLLPLLIDDLNSITLGSKDYPIIDHDIDVRTIAMGPTRYPMYYQFITPWVALNPDNYHQYQSLYDWSARKGLLNRILVGNCLSLASGLEIFVPFKLYAHTHLDQVEVNIKTNRLTGFVGRFKVNFQLPPLIGIGKGVSRGYGTVLPMPSQKITLLPVQSSEELLYSESNKHLASSTSSST